MQERPSHSPVEIKRKRQNQAVFCSGRKTIGELSRWNLDVDTRETNALIVFKGRAKPYIMREKKKTWPDIVAPLNAGRLTG